MSTNAEQKFRETNDLLQAVFDSAPNGIAVMQTLYDENGRVQDFTILLFNAYTLKWIGNTEYKGKRYSDVFPMVRQTGILEKFKEVAETGVAANFDRWYTGEGMNHWFRFTAVKQGELLVVTTENITEQKQAEEKIRQSEERFEAAVKAVQGVLWTNNAKGEMEGEQAGWASLTGQSHEDYQSYGWAKAVHPQDAQPTIDAWNEAVRERKTFEFMHRVKRRNGEWGFFSIRAIPLFDAAGSIREWVGVHTDITEKQKAENAIRESESRFRNLVQDASAAIVVLTGDEMKVEIVNEAYGRLIERTPDELLGKPVFSVVPEAEAYYRPVLEKVRRTGETVILQDTPYTVKKYDKVIEGFLHVVSQPYRDVEGKSLGVMQIIQDVTVSVKSRKALEESEEDLRNLILQAPIGICVMDASSLVSEIVNDKFVDIAGKPYEAIMGKHYWDTFAEAAPYYEGALQGVVEKGEPFYASEVELMLIRHGREEIIYVTFVYEPMKDANGVVKKVVIWVLENTVQVQARRKIQESETRFRSMADASPVMIWTLDAQGNSAYYNKTATDFTGHTEEELKDGKTWQTAIHPDDLKFAAEVVSNAVQSIKSYQIECRMKRADGKWRWLLSHGTPRLSKNDELLGYVGSSVDITERKEAENALIESEERFRLLSNEMPQFVWTGDAAGTLGYFNKAVYEFSGLSIEDIQNGGWLQIVHPEDREENIRLWQESIATGRDFIFEHRFKRADGEYRWQLSRAVAQRDARGIIQQWIGTSTDIQDQKNVEEQLEKLVAERTKELQRSNEDLQQFAHVASHDLKEPVRKIKTFTGRLEHEMDGQLNEKAKQYLSKVHSAINRMYSMIDGVLAYSTVSASPKVTQQVDLIEILNSIETDLEVTIQNTGAVIQYTDLPVLEGEPVLIYQLFYNLITNSIKFAKAGVPPAISIQSKTTVEDRRNVAQIIVKDNGIGFEQEHVQMIFDTFTRLNSKDTYEGTGLGLSLCRKIVEHHGGTITASGKLNEGASFLIMLPLSQKK